MEAQVSEDDAFAEMRALAGELRKAGTKSPGSEAKKGSMRWILPLVILAAAGITAFLLVPTVWWLQMIKFGGLTLLIVIAVGILLKIEKPFTVGAAIVTAIASIAGYVTWLWGGSGLSIAAWILGPLALILFGITVYLVAADGPDADLLIFSVLGALIASLAVGILFGWQYVPFGVGGAAFVTLIAATVHDADRIPLAIAGIALPSLGVVAAWSSLGQTWVIVPVGVAAVGVLGGLSSYLLMTRGRRGRYGLPRATQVSAVFIAAGILAVASALVIGWQVARVVSVLSSTANLTPDGILGIALTQGGLGAFGLACVALLLGMGSLAGSVFFLRFAIDQVKKIGRPVGVEFTKLQGTVGIPKFAKLEFALRSIADRGTVVPSGLIEDLIYTLRHRIDGTRHTEFELLNEIRDLLATKYGMGPDSIREVMDGVVMRLRELPP
jgi:hypothetical protein